MEKATYGLIYQSGKRHVIHDIAMKGKLPFLEQSGWERAVAKIGSTVWQTIKKVIFYLEGERGSFSSAFH